ncbi:TonB-dependent receptor [Congregibacter variabilis]|uniref:TonB-dependent receptor n=1 Tax=Congregibacter variabilis TaxID=3081200 RepID=A0ABZ0HXG6_9GAMM|nr:TonB-dependent receptor [Congregibacter sp. IMCC43200]
MRTSFGGLMMKRRFDRHVGATAAFVAAFNSLIVSLPAQAQLEEVIVTATKRAEGLQDIPISVTAFSQNDMDIRGFSNLQGIQEATPNLNFSVQSAGQNVARVTLRGVGTETLVGGGDPGVAVHIDGVYVGRNSVAAGDIFDIARVEVLRGPQGTLYGRNANGGSINIITQRPNDEFEANVDLAIGNYSSQRARAVVNGPLTDSISARAALFSDKRDGFYNNLFNGRDGDDKDSVGGRLQFLWESESGNEVLLRGYYQHFNSIGPGSTYLGDDIPATATGYPAAHITGVSSGPRPPAGAPISGPLYSNVTTASGDPILPRPTGLRDIRKDAPEFLDQTIKGVDLEANFQISDAVLLRSISSFQTNDNEILVDSDNSELPIQTRYRNNEAEQYSQEFNLISQSESRLQWILGAYIYHEELQETFNTTTPAGLLPLTVPLPPGAVPGGGGIAQTRIAFHEVDSYALFAQLSYDLADRTKLTLGLRQTWDEKSQNRPTGGQVDLTNGYRLRGGGALGPLPPTTADADWSELTYRASIDHELSDDSMVFASVSRGYKSGGFDLNGGALLDGQEQVPYDPEYVNAYEIGSKNKFYDGRVVLNLTAFLYDYTDLQVFRLTGDGPLTDNAAESTIWGLEAETEFAVTEAFVLDASVGYLDATYDEYFVEVPPPTTDFSGQTLNYAPEWTAHIGGEYTAMIGDARLIFRADWSYRSDTYFDRANTDFDTQDAYSLFNARIRYDAGSWFADVFGNNLGDETYVTGQLINPPFACGCRTVNVGPPQTYGVTVGYRWD